MTDQTAVQSTLGRQAVTTPVLKTPGELEPILPDWMRTKAGVRATVGRWVRRNGWRVLAHAWYLPVYAGRLALYAPNGLYLTLQMLYRFVTDHEGHEVRIHAAARKESTEYRAQRKLRNDAVRNRLITVGVFAGPPILYVVALLSPAVAGALLGLVIGSIALVVLMDFRGLVALVGLPIVGWIGGPSVLGRFPVPPDWLVGTSTFALVMVLGRIGFPKEKHLLHNATVVEHVKPTLSEQWVRGALVKLGIEGMKEKQADEIRFLGPVRQLGEGWIADVELPPGTTVEEVQKRRPKLAGAMRYELGCTWPEQGKRHPSHLKLYVSDQDMRSGVQRPWPMFSGRAVDVFDKNPVLTNTRGEWIQAAFGGERIDDHWRNTRYG